MSYRCDPKCRYFHGQVFEETIIRVCTKPVDVPCPTQFALKSVVDRCDTCGEVSKKSCDNCGHTQRSVEVKE